MPLKRTQKPKPNRQGIIEIRLREIAQLFNSLDPAPFPEKDLDSDAEEFIVSWAEESDPAVPLTLRVHLTNPPADPAFQDATREGVCNYFEYRAQMARHRLRQLLSRGRASLLIGLAFLVVCLLGAEWVGRVWEGTFAGIASESLIIAGWVAMWRPLEIFLYDWWPIRAQRNVYRRLSAASVEVIFDGTGRNGPGGAALVR